jgi:sugar transferase (PEP-CTERM system associated)
MKLLGMAEFACFAAVPYLAFALLGRPYPRYLYVDAVIFAVVQCVTLLSMGLYSRRQRARLAGQVVRAAAAIFAGCVAIGFVFYMVSALFLDRAALTLAAALALVAFTVLRFVAERISDEEIFARRIVVYGAGKHAAAISGLRRRSDRRGFRILGYIPAHDEMQIVPGEAVISNEGGLLQCVRDLRADEIVVAIDDRRRGFPVHELLDCRLAGFDVTDILDFFERETGKVRLDVLNPAWLIFSDGFGRSMLQNFVERCFDVASSLLLLVFTWPFMLLAVIAIKVEEGLSAPVLYGQIRVGIEGKPFRVLKFRSMRVDAEKGGKAVWAATVDPRVTRFGAFMRKVRIDELPQLFNILLGDMRFVGPRPERPEFVTQLEQRIPYYAERHTVKPGLTGWAQLCYPYGSSERDAAEKLQYDLYYVKNRSLLFDLVILLQTVEVVLWGKGAR